MDDSKQEGLEGRNISQGSLNLKPIYLFAIQNCKLLSQHEYSFIKFALHISKFYLSKKQVVLRGPEFFRQIELIENSFNCSDWMNKSRPTKICHLFFGHATRLMMSIQIRKEKK